MSIPGLQPPSDTEPRVKDVKLGARDCSCFGKSRGFRETGVEVSVGTGVGQMSFPPGCQIPTFWPHSELTTQ